MSIKMKRKSFIANIQTDLAYSSTAEVGIWKKAETTEKAVSIHSALQTLEREKTTEAVMAEAEDNDTSSPEHQDQTKINKKKHHDSKENAEETDGDRNNDNGANRDETVEDGSVVVTGKNVGDAKYAAVKNFLDSGLPENVLQCCKGFEKPSPIQSRAWPFLLDRRDLIGIAATRSGKTLAFLVTVVECLTKELLKFHLLTLGLVIWGSG